ncbi:MAG: hypothetical protein MJZ03_02740 [archaeon]|nr:hypothetical protein [archaeon]
MLGNVAADESNITDPNINVTPEQDWCGVNKTLKCTLRGNDDYYFLASFLNSSGSSSGTISPYNGKLSGSSHNGSIDIKAPEEGDYVLKLEFFLNSDKSEHVGIKEIPIKIVKPIKLKFTLKNNNNTNVDLPVFIKINGKKVEDSVQNVSINANSTKNITYDFFTRDVNNTVYSLETESKICSISGLGCEKKFYPSDNNYFIIEIIVVVVLVIMLMVLLRIYQKPVRNTGKPKGRR